MCVEDTDLAAENCVVLIYVNINEPRHRMMRAFCALVGVEEHV